MQRQPLPHSPRERVLDALKHKQPERVPFSWNFGPTPEMEYKLRMTMLAQSVDWHAFAKDVDDIRQVSPRYIGPELTQHIDIWGIERKIQPYGEGTYDEIARYPLAGMQDLAWLKSYPWPDPYAYDYERFRDEVIEADPDGLKACKMAINVCGNPFEIYCWMTGLAEALINVLLYPDIVHAAMQRITAFFEIKLRRALEKVSDLVDILYFADDLGGQQNLLMSLKIYRKLIKPYHVQLFSLAHKLAPHAAVMFHSDGAVFNVVPDLIDAGIDILEAVQIDAAGMDPQRLKATFGDKLSFHGGISVQNLLPLANRLTINHVCRKLIDVMGKGGGYIAAPSHAIQVGTPPENVFAMLQAVLGEKGYDQVLIASSCV
jgi:uroporphyrinogen decarboxylase